MTYTAAKKPRKEELALREAALAYPQTTEDFPWDHRAMKVKGKAFVFMGTGEDGTFFFTVKLPRSNAMALLLPFAKEARYGLGKSGWVASQFAKGEDIPVGLLKEWVDESYRAVAPKTLVKALDAGAPLAADKPRTKTSTTTSSKKASAKKKAR